VAAVVVDASVMVSLFVEEKASAPARSALLRAREDGHSLHAPDLILAECANAFWKRVGRGEFGRDAAMAALGALSNLDDLKRHALDAPLALPALSLAMAHSLTAYDALYAALAVQLGGTVLSGDKRFVERATEAGLPVVSVSG
jgi:predicted nucleic acid-binding protein